MTAITRRSLLGGAAAFTVTFSLTRGASASVSTVADSVDGYLSVEPDGGVTVFAGKVDLGTGARAAIRQMPPRSLAFRRDASPSSRATRRLRPIRVRPGAARKSWSAGCRSGRRPPPPARGC